MINTFIAFDNRCLVLGLSERRESTNILDLASFGLFLILVGVIFMQTPNLFDRGYSFFNDLEIRELSPNIYLPAPKSDHSILYNALSRFCFYFAILQIPVLILRFILKDPIDKKADTVSGLLFWFGAAWIINLMIVNEIVWTTFLGYLIVLVGISVVIRNALCLGMQAYRRS
jgi:hypothetical protein